MQFILQWPLNAAIPKPGDPIPDATVIMQEGMIGSGHLWKCVATNIVDNVQRSADSEISFAVGMCHQIIFQYL